MSEEIEETDNYIIYDTLEDALVKADAEGSRRGYAYHRVGSGTRYKTYPQATADDKYALLVCLLYTSPSPRDVEESRMPSSA